MTSVVRASVTVVAATITAPTAGTNPDRVSGRDSSPPDARPAGSGPGAVAAGAADPCTVRPPGGAGGSSGGDPTVPGAVPPVRSGRR
ncbi:MAG: hypothetical protein KatS3mg009_0505 [Acidimicrobiia bacterium]|nr:MAG: hypothetical protein KatS3mg009_0505 [Acidimicrobiia bacterium]